MLDQPHDQPSQNQAAERPFVTCENCGGAVTLNKTGRPRAYPFCNRPACRRAADAARARAARAGKRPPPIDPPLPDHVRTVHGNNGNLIAAAARLYVPKIGAGRRCHLGHRRVLASPQWPPLVHAHRIRHLSALTCAPTFDSYPTPTPPWT